MIEIEADILQFVLHYLNKGIYNLHAKKASGNFA